jgi:hypothetical protein
MDRPVRHRREQRRRINRRQQGDLGETSAIEWLTRIGAGVWTPLGHSPDADLVAEVEGRLFRVQVKTTTMEARTPNGHQRWEVALATNGGNQSWNRVAKTFDPARFDFLFVLVGDGRRWFLPAQAIEARYRITLGGRKYSEFEVVSAEPIDRLVYREPDPASKIQLALGGVSKRSKDGGCKPSGYAFAGSTPASPISTDTADGGVVLERLSLGAAGSQQPTPPG